MTSIEIHGEISADGRNIIIMAAGPDYAVAHEAKRLALLTPLIKPSKPPGALVMPLSWPGCVQMAMTFGGAWTPGPRLSAWLLEQVSARTGYRTKELRYQRPAAVVALGFDLYPWQRENAKMIAHCEGGLVTDDPGPQPVTTPILTDKGWRQLGDLTAGDSVFDVHGRLTRIRAIKHFGVQPVYRVTLNDRTSTLATKDHRWLVWTKNDRKRKYAGRVVTTENMYKVRLKSTDGAARFFLPKQPVLDLPPSGTLPLDPYAYGTLLGDGSLGGSSLSLACPDDHVMHNVATESKRLGTTVRQSMPDNGRCQQLRFWRNGSLTTALEQLGARVKAHDKHVHVDYLYGDEPTRRAVLAGLLDTDGCAAEGASVEFSSASTQLSADVAFLGRSLGAVVMESYPQSAGYRKNGIWHSCQDRHRVHLRFPTEGLNPFTIPRKAAVWADHASKAQRKHPARSVQSIEIVGEQSVCCIELDTGNDDAKVYLTDTTLIPTHNTGKTQSAIVGLAERELWGTVSTPAVVVCPPSVVDSWVRAFELWTPHWRTTAWRGTPAKRAELVGQFDIYVTGYPLVRRDAAPGMALGKSPLMRIKAKSVIADEVQNINNPDAVQTRATQRLVKNAQVFVPMSGTPVTHNVKGLHPTLEVMEPGAYPAGERFTARYALESAGDYGTDIMGLNPGNEPEFRTSLLGRMERHNKKDCLPNLPDKVYSIREVELPPEYLKAYKAMENQMIAELPDGQEMSVMSVLTQILRLQQLSSAAADVETVIELDQETGEPKEKQKVTLKFPSWKVDALLEVLAERPGQPVVCFAPSRQLIMLAGQAASAAGLRVGYIVGGQKPAERTESIDEFMAGGTDLLCATTQAGGTGLTLTAAGTFVFLQRPYSLVESLQAEDRGHRIGTKHQSIEIIDIFAKGTIDGRIRSILHEKAVQLGELLKDPRIVTELLGGKSVRRLRAVS